MDTTCHVDVARCARSEVPPCHLGQDSSLSPDLICATALSPHLEPRDRHSIASMVHKLACLGAALGLVVPADAFLPSQFARQAPKVVARQRPVVSMSETVSPPSTCTVIAAGNIAGFTRPPSTTSLDLPPHTLHITTTTISPPHCHHRHRHHRRCHHPPTAMTTVAIATNNTSPTLVPPLPPPPPARQDRQARLPGGRPPRQGRRRERRWPSGWTDDVAVAVELAVP